MGEGGRGEGVGGDHCLSFHKMSFSALLSECMMAVLATCGYIIANIVRLTDVLCMREKGGSMALVGAW